MNKCFVNRNLGGGWWFEWKAPLFVSYISYINRYYRLISPRPPNPILYFNKQRYIYVSLMYYWSVANFEG